MGFTLVVWGKAGVISLYFTAPYKEMRVDNTREYISAAVLKKLDILGVNG